MMDGVRQTSIMIFIGQGRVGGFVTSDEGPWGSEGD